MSLILDALNRSRRDAEPVPGIATEHAVAAPAERGPRLLWLVVAILLIAVVWLLFDRGEEEPAEAADVTAVGALSNNVSSALASVKAELKSQANTVAEIEAPAEPAAAVEQLTGHTGAPEPLPQPVKQAVEKPVQSEEQSEEKGDTESARQDIARLYEQSEATAQREAELAQQPQAEPLRREEPVDVEKMLLRAREEMQDARLVEHSAPFLATLSQVTKDAIPTVLYQRHDYSGTPGRSSVVINSKTLQEGESAAPGMKVQEILPDSVVLDYRGTVFRLRALNSWVNL